MAPRLTKKSILLVACLCSCFMYYYLNAGFYAWRQGHAFGVSPSLVSGLRQTTISFKLLTSHNNTMTSSSNDSKSLNGGINVTMADVSRLLHEGIASSRKNEQDSFNETPVKSYRITSLVDIPTNFNFTHKGERIVKYTILWYNPAEWIVRRDKTLRMDTCEYNNCELTENKQLLGDSHAVIFGITMNKMGSMPPVSQSERKPGQVWLFYSLEPPIYHIYQQEYKTSAWHNTLNWSMTFNFDSDVFAPYGTFKSKPKHDLHEPDYDKVFDMKTKMAVWVVSNCGSKSRRSEYVSALRAAGLDVDIYGSCGEHGRHYGEIRDLTKQYKFYLSMENSFCKYYVTEKVLERYNDDVVMVIRGGADYSSFIPEGTYIDAGMFANVTSLAKYLTALGSDRQRYIEMLRKKNRYFTLNEDQFGYPYAMCELCRKLNNKDDTRKTYGNLEQEVQKEGRCTHQEDIVIR